MSCNLVPRPSCEERVWWWHFGCARWAWEEPPPPLPSKRTVKLKCPAVLPLARKRVWSLLSVILVVQGQQYMTCSVICRDLHTCPECMLLRNNHSKQRAEVWIAQKQDCWHYTTKRMLKCHQTFFLVRGWGLGTILRPISLLLSLLSPLSHNTHTFKPSCTFTRVHTYSASVSHMHTYARTHTGFIWNFKNAGWWIESTF